MFDTSEKKLTIYFDKNKCPSLLALTDDFWLEMCKRAGAEILNKIENKYCRAYVLSESSLFVWADRILLITCGNTQVANAAKYLLEVLQKCAFCDGDVALAVNKLTMHLPNSHLDEYENWQAWFSVKGLPLSAEITTLGTTYQHIKETDYLNLFNSRNHYHFSALPLNIVNDFRQFTAKQQIAFLRLDQVLADFTVQYHAFEPWGFSLNALKKDSFICLHISPEYTNSLITIESNLDLSTYVNKWHDLLSPKVTNVVKYGAKADSYTVLRTALVEETA
ncbi:hypothetical protein HR060_13780 [Catenovulum sp. SM1970]|uniref:hypothetical protein n=1 Tax=Marinifaba aquimaris TaxID=2741323 RepID=UPI001571DDDB|nr:hypothetical protein [Marinifaba aquimaris]NTS77924.1 hypothetical protein [Marinifaba aquimaris]